MPDYGLWEYKDNMKYLSAFIVSKGTDYNLGVTTIKTTFGVDRRHSSISSVHSLLFFN
jgi:hypothetical protein